MKDASAAAHDRIALLIFWAVPAVIRPGAPRAAEILRLRTRVNELRLRNCQRARRLTSQNEIEAPAAAVAAVSAADRGNVGGMARCRQPVVDRGADSPALNRRLAGR